MKTNFYYLSIALTLLAAVHQAGAQGTAFTYQGQLFSGANSAHGIYNFTFSLYNTNSGGAAIAPTVTNNVVGVTNGLFTVLVDFGSNVFTGTNYWLEIGVETNSASPFTTLAPRQQLTPAPYAIYAESVAASGIIGTLIDAQLTHSAVTVDVGSGLSGGGKVGLGKTIILTNTGVLSVSGNADITASTVGGAVTLGDTATNTDTAGAIVKRDSSGNFSAASITLDGTLNLPAITVSSPDIIYSGDSFLLYNDNNENFASGVNAGYFGTSGSFNTAIGSGALFSNTNSDNTAVGFEALGHNSDGSDNAANGYEALAYNTSGSDNTANGSQALYSNTSGSDNTANGSQALLFNTNGSYNTANGVEALAYNTSGSDNTANGYQALYLNTGGSNNTASGADSLSSNTSGSGNTANGYSSLSSNTNGADNTANGDEALAENTSGSNNTANGFQALYSNTSGSNNTADGYQALYSNNASGNTADGYNSLFSNTNGRQNTAIGANALFSNTNGYQNTAVGWGALYSNASGISNIVLGFDAGYNITAGSNNIEIGNAGAAPDNNTIRIGGTQTNTFIAGIFGATVSGSAVTVNSSGQLGVAPSSQRFKQDIHSMDEASSVLLSLRPVTFKYKPGIDPNGTPQFGLVAEEVAKADPDLVVRDGKDQIFTVRYEAVNAMLLNEFLKQHHKVEEQASEMQTLKQQNDSLADRLKELEARVQSFAEKK